MKTNLQVTGRVELTHQEITKAIVEFLEKHHNYKSEKIIYECEWRTGMPDPLLKGAVVEIRGIATDTHEEIKSYHIDKPITRKHNKGRVRVNIGIFDTMRALLNDAFIRNGKKHTVISYEQFFEDVKEFHPAIDHVHLRLYLVDRRQMTSSLIWNAKKNQLEVVDMINFIPGRKHIKSRTV